MFIIKKMNRFWRNYIRYLTEIKDISFNNFFSNFDKRGYQMDYRIVNLDFDLKIIGKGKVVKTSRAFKTIPTLWSSAKKMDLCNN